MIRPVEMPVGLVPLPGGNSGETFLAEVAGERTVVRVYGARGADRGPRAAEVDAALLRLVRGLLPVPEVLEVRRPDDRLGVPGVLVTSLLPGERLDEVWPAASASVRTAIAANLGVLLSRLAQMPMPRPGEFRDGELRIEPMPAAATDLSAWVRAHTTGTALQAWPAAALDGLLRVAEEAQHLVDAVRRTCLVHSDFNPKNLLVDPVTGEVTGLVDWEYAHAGSPFTDLGNLLRFEDDDDVRKIVLATYAERVPDAPPDLLSHARAADLFALVDLAARRGQNPVADRAHETLYGIARRAELD